MRDDDYQKFISPFRTAVAEGSTYIDLAKKVFVSKTNFVAFAGACSSTSATIYASTGNSAANLLFLGPAVGIPTDTIDKATQSLLQATKVDEDIEFIKSRLSTIQPDVSADFQRFLTTYYSEADTTTKYMELIGLRTLVYFRFVFAFAESAGFRSSTRAQQMRCFLYGNNPITDKPAEDILILTKELWDDLSDQDPSGQSIKAGRVTATYVELIFRKAITILSALLREREMVFRP